jgi:hypothetical protein
MKTMYQKATGAEETCMMCPHRICPHRDPDTYECPARVREKLLEETIEIALVALGAGDLGGGRDLLKQLDIPAKH